jgi:hypothetical protein
LGEAVLFWAGAVASAYVGFRLFDWWVPALVACAVVAIQFVLFKTVLDGKGSGLELLVFSMALNLVVYYATYGIGRAMAERFKQRRKGVR